MFVSIFYSKRLPVAFSATYRVKKGKVSFNNSTQCSEVFMFWPSHKSENARNHLMVADKMLILPFL